MIEYKSLTSKDVTGSAMAAILITLLIIFFMETAHYSLIAIGLLIVTMTVPNLFKPFAFIWLNLAQLLGEISSKVILTTIFFVIVTPIGIIIQYVRKDPLNIRSFKRSKDSVFKTKDHMYTQNDIINPY